MEEKVEKESGREEKKRTCPECGSFNLIYDHKRGEVYCADCGFIAEDLMIDEGPEWRAFDREQWEKQSRVGAPLTLTIHDKGLSTVIDRLNKDIHGRSLSAEKRQQLARLRRWQQRARVSNASEKNLAIALSEIERLSSLLNLPSYVKESAALIYRRVAEKNLVKGRSIESIVAAAVLAACRQHKIPRTLDEISKISGVDKKKLGKTYKFIARKLRLKLMPASPLDFVERFGEQLGLSGETIAKAREIVQKAIEMDLSSGRDPTGIAAAALYIAGILTGEKRSQSEIARVSGTSEVTVRNRYREIAEKLNLEIIV